MNFRNPERKSRIHCWSLCSIHKDFWILTVMQYMKQVQTVLSPSLGTTDSAVQQQYNMNKYIQDYQFALQY